VSAVAAAQSLRYAEQVDDAATAAAELAHRLQAAGNFSALQVARTQAFVADAATGLVQARRAQRQTREALVRALGLDDAQAGLLKLPERLPQLPVALPAEAPTRQSALDTRLDLQLARARLDELARAQGLTRASGTIDTLALGAERRATSGQPSQHGVALTMPVPLWDRGDAARAGAAARYDAALARVSALAVAAASQLREADGERRDAHALALQFRDQVLPLHETIASENLLRYNAMLASPFELLSDAREQARTVQQAIAAQRDFWLADAGWQAAAAGAPSPASLDADLPETTR
jgi:outer membrane protein TolC